MFRVASRSCMTHLIKNWIPCVSATVGRFAGSSEPAVEMVKNYSTSTSAEQRLAGQVAIITGGASGIGARTSRLFTEHGARVVIADVQASLGEKLAKELGPQAEFVLCDVRKEEDIIHAWDKAYSLENKLDVVINNAGIFGALCPLYELPMAEFDETMAVNLRGVMLGVKHAARLMIPARKGSIICTSSGAGLNGGLCPISYSTSKAAIVALAKCAAAELSRFGIRVNSISPDIVPSPMSLAFVHAMISVGKFSMESKSSIEADSSSAKDEGRHETLTLEMLDDMTKQHSLIEGRSLTDTDVANASLYLASDMGGYVTGHNLAIDGGRSTIKFVDPDRTAWATTYQPMVNVGGRRGL